MQDYSRAEANQGTQALNTRAASSGGDKTRRDANKTRGTRDLSPINQISHICPRAVDAFQGRKTMSHVQINLEFPFFVFSSIEYAALNYT